VLKGIADRLRQQMRRWDLESAARVDQYIASSKVVQQRIKSYYGKDSLVVAPPIDLEQFRPVKRPSGDYFLVVSALMKYKRVDIAVEAFNALGMRLKVVGDGEEAGSLKRIAGPTIEFLGRVPDSELPNLYANCRAFIFTAEEDFGITPIEAMACGRPVVAFGAGGATETVVPGTTGVFFSSQTADALVEIVRTTNFESFDTIAIRSRAEQFGAPAFHESIRAIVNRLDEHDPPREVEFQ
jgi:glycosyltransferase involved in cell wall biosynthesis